MNYYPPQNQPQYPPQNQPQGQGYYPPPQNQPYYPPQNQPPPQQPLARGTIDDFYDQRAAMGKSISFDKVPPGTSYTGIVPRTVTHADIEQQTEMHTRRPATHPDGSPKLTMKIPLQMQPSAEFPDGRAVWYCKANDRPELERAMEEAGVPRNAKGHLPPPEMGAVITITYTGDRPVPGLNAQKMKTVVYRRPPGAVTGNGNYQQPAATPQEPANAPEQYGQPPFQAPYDQGGVLPQPAATANQPARTAEQNPAGLTPEQLQLLETLRGQHQ